MKIGVKIGLIIFGIFVFANCILFDYFLFTKKLFLGGQSVTGETLPVAEVEKNESECDADCIKNLVAEKVEEELAKITPSAGSSAVPTSSPKKTNEAKVVYVPLITSGTASLATWTDVVPSEFYFNLSDYAGAKEVRFEAYLLSMNNDLVYARLYDVTNKRGVDYSDISTKNSIFTRVESSGVKIWQGNNKYTIQLRSVNDTGSQIKDARLKIIY